MNLDEIENNEHLDGITFNWNCFPVTREEENEMTSPVGCIYRPLTDSVKVDKSPIRCGDCNSVLNKYDRLDKAIGKWSCSICGYRNNFWNDAFDQFYQRHEIQYNSVEYQLPQSHDNIINVIYVIDLTMGYEELQILKQSILQSISDFKFGNFGLITFNANVSIYNVGELSFLQRIYSLQGKILYNSDRLRELLSLESSAVQTSGSRFMTFDKDKIIHAVQRLKSTYDDHQLDRPLRATGLALLSASLIISKLESSSSKHIILYTNGPCTSGLGKIVSTDKKQSIRTFNDIIKRKANTKYLDTAAKFYNDTVFELAKRHRFSVSLFTASYDQSGVCELGMLITKTGGGLIMVDSFTSNIFRENHRLLFIQDEGLVFHSNSEMKVLTSRKLKVAGFIGSAHSVKPLESENGMLSDISIGQGFSNIFRSSMISTRDFYNIFFKMDTVGMRTERDSIPPFVIIQFQTKYLHNDGSWRLKVTTIQKPTTNFNSYPLEESFDEEVFTILFTREILYRLTHGTIDNHDIIPIIEKALINITTRYSTFVKNDESSFRYLSKFQNVPQFFYNLINKSNLLKFFNFTPDEIISNMIIFQNLSVSDAILMIQPTLLQYSLDSPEPIPILLDSNALLKTNVILLMDSFTHLVIHIGDEVARWRDNYDIENEYNHIAEFLDHPKIEAIELLKERFPLPRYVITDQGRSQDRFLKAKLSPVNNGTNSILTEEESLFDFYNRLIAKVVKS
ncbi:hypothetical protein WICMUC_003618 [Wickerhamomyces mucosus]|uniref:Protein transport protein SEC23 n=1 Tax=Wickerhamomyces mucosus TaxID=1378264 RepID=A0A9P8PLC9_9ASCO|nr:hypothetical protein WICMUC_003618 [Wickerhamomyces mucosus]